MKKIGCIILAIICFSISAEAQVAKQNIVDGVSVDSLSIERSGRFIVVDMTLDLNELDVRSNSAVLLTPHLSNDSITKELRSVGVYGRKRYFYYLRNYNSMLTGSEEQSFRAAQKPSEVAYHYVMPYEEWMNGSELSLHRSVYGCNNTLLAEQEGILCRHKEEFFPELVYIRPTADSVKFFALSGSAYIDFPVDKTIIYPDYRRNTVELGKIQATIDSVKNDQDITITSVWLKGHASPESPYTHNRDLAIGRTEALKQYIKQLYSFEDGLIATDYEPEDWTGLRKYVEESNLEHRTEILAMIDGDLQPDAKETKIKRTYPKEYKFLLQNCYPALRHTDYRIEYTIRVYTDIEEIKRIMLEQPQKLSLNELYLVAQSYEPGSEEFSDVFETAVRLFPKDAIANLNAANAAMYRGDLSAAEEYLTKAGDSPEAVYARGALAIRKGEYDIARGYMAQAKALGLKQAEKTLHELEQGRR